MTALPFRAQAPRRALVLLSISALLAVASGAVFPLSAQDKTNAGPLIAEACIGCHGQGGAGQGPVPRIAGYSRELFVAQWSAFKANERPATIMGRIARGYTDAEVAALADYFASLK